jgi:ATP-dependent DNA helicase RecQ
LFDEILKMYWGYESFRPLQKENHSIGLGAKRHARADADRWRQIASFSGACNGNAGLCLVITPLIALMKDQVDNFASVDQGIGRIFGE